jgi:hypothetical protein
MSRIHIFKNKIIYNFVKFVKYVATKKNKRINFSPYCFAAFVGSIRNPRQIKIRILDPATLVTGTSMQKNIKQVVKNITDML